ncbi:hypothetical protein B9479_000471 [Cryptococcus floricola]|uniref:Mitochondrial import inner membrane translocase subunit TIM54 n=1 Tax=Cryptococcus floricola TaxID=2591691 RepID=A0A5D3B4E9_9TREE|nr:hypothetical protein B9479_000471 [Cryptococcus floricola]
MSTPPPPTPAPTPPKPPVPPPKPPVPPAAPAELTGFRSALAHTGIPHSVLTYSPRLPSRNWLIFWSLSISVTSLYIYDRRECKKIKEETVKRVEKYGQEPLPGGSLGEARRVKVWGGKWGGDEDTDRANRYFRKYVKPYLVAAGIDYDIPANPLHGSIARQLHASILALRRTSLSLDAPAPTLSLPGYNASPLQKLQREIEGGVVIVGRASLKEYLEGLRRGWEGGVDKWEWEQQVREQLAKDDLAVFGPEDAAPAPAATQNIPAHWHVPPIPLPPSPPICLLPFTNHLGFFQLPNMIYDFFTERHKVQAGADAAISLIEGGVRDMTREDAEHWEESSQGYYNKMARTTKDRMQKARDDYYGELTKRVQDARAYEMGEREMTDEEKKANKVTKIADLKEERVKRELRWMGNEEGWDIVKPDTPATWRDNWEGWLKVYDLPADVKENGL